MADFGVTSEIREGHGYIGHWLHVLDKRTILSVLANARMFERLMSKRAMLPAPALRY